MNETNPSRNESISVLLAGVLDDLRKLLRLELQLAQARVQEKLGELGRAGAYVGVGFVLLIPTSLMLAITLALGLADLTGWSPWLCHALVTSLFALTAVIFLFVGVRAARALPEPDHSDSNPPPALEASSKPWTTEKSIN